jgi:molybdopterin-guanine dinucleotide biosynthesis protein A
VGCREIVIAGDITSTGTVTVREEPPFGGPVAGLAAALDRATGEWILLLACDLPRAGELCGLIAGEAGRIPPRADGIVVAAEGRRQWLSGLYRHSSLESSLAGLGDPSGASLQTLLGSLDLVEVDDPAGLSRDIDTPKDLAALQRKETP